MLISLIQNAPTLSKEKNIQIVKDYISKHKNSKLIVFPELVLSGYMLQDGVFDNYFTKEEILDLFKDTKPDIILSCALYHKNNIFNTAIYLSSGNIVHIHYKNQLPNYTFFQEARYYKRGNKIRSIDTAFGKMVIVICEDLWNEKSLYKICKLKPDVVVVLSASPSRDFDDDLYIKEKWDSILKTTSILTRAYCLFVNRVGFEDGLGFWGGSKVVLPNAKILKEAKLFQEDAIEFEIEPLNNRAYLFDKYTKR